MYFPPECVNSYQSEFSIRDNISRQAIPIWILYFRRVRAICDLYKGGRASIWPANLAGQ